MKVTITNDETGETETLEGDQVLVVVRDGEDVSVCVEGEEARLWEVVEEAQTAGKVNLN